MAKYFFKRARSPYLQFRLVNPPRVARLLGWRIKEESTGTADEDEAFILFHDQIAEHKRNLMMTRDTATHKHKKTSFYELAAVPILAPGEEDISDDGAARRASDDGKHLVITYPGGRMEVVPNSLVKIPVIAGSDFSEKELVAIYTKANKPLRDIDKLIRDHWADGRSPADIRMVDKVMQIVHEVAPQRSLATLEPGDARRVIEKLFALGNSTSSVKRKMQVVNGMINNAIGHEDFKFLMRNPFEVKELIPKRHQNVKGVRPSPRRFEDGELALISKDIKNWRDDERLLWTMLRVMGQRLSEANHTIGEEQVEGYRCITYGTKNEKTHRCVPLPRVVSEMLPNRIEGKIFQRNIKSINSDMMCRLDALGIKRFTGKSAQSLRHMVETELSNNDVRQRVIDAIMGQVPDDLKSNQNENQAVREMKSNKYRYFMGCRAQHLYEAMETITTGF